MKITNKIKGLGIGVLAAALYGTNPLFALPLYGEGFDAAGVLFYRYFFAIPIMAVLMKLTGVSFRPKNSRNLLLLLFMGFMMAMSSYTLFESYNYMDVGIASTLLFLYPLLVALIMWMKFKEKLGVMGWSCLLAATVGIGMLCHGGGDATVSLTGIILVFISSLTYAIYIVAVNRTGLSEESPMRVIFYVLCVGFVWFGVQMAATGNISVPSTPTSWGCVLGLALLPTALSFWLTTVAISKIGSTTTAVLGAFEPVTALLISVGVFGEVLGIRELFGIAVILISVSCMSGGKQAVSSLRSIGFHKKHLAQPKH